MISKIFSSVFLIFFSKEIVKRSVVGFGYKEIELLFSEVSIPVKSIGVPIITAVSSSARQ